MHPRLWPAFVNVGSIPRGTARQSMGRTHCLMPSQPVRPPEDRVLFLEIYVPDASEFSAQLHVRVVEVGSHQVLRAESAAVANGIAALLYICAIEPGKCHMLTSIGTKAIPYLYMIRYVLSGYGECRANNPRSVSSGRAQPRTPAANPCPDEMRVLDVKFLRWDNSFPHHAVFIAIQNHAILESLALSFFRATESTR